jgi:hypothetical protein
VCNMTVFDRNFNAWSGCPILPHWICSSLWKYWHCGNFSYKLSGMVCGGDPEFVICMKNSWKKPFVFPVKTLNFPHFYFRHMYQIPGMNTFCLGYVTITVTGIMWKIYLGMVLNARNPALKRLRQEDREFEASQGYISRSCVKHFQPHS